jgi:hypothetical protein
VPAVAVWAAETVAEGEWSCATAPNVSRCRDTPGHSGPLLPGRRDGFDLPCYAQSVLARTTGDLQKSVDLFRGLSGCRWPTSVFYIFARKW